MSAFPLHRMIRLLLLILTPFASVGVPTLPAQSPSVEEPTPRYFRSNELGMALEEIGWYRTDEASYVLEVRTEPDREVRVLLHDRVEIRRWERSRRQARVYEAGLLSEVELLDSRGRTAELREYREGALMRRTAFTYPRPSEVVATSFDAEGRTEFTERTLLTAQGSLRNVRRESPGGEGSQFSLSMAADRLLEERAAADEHSLVKRYDSRGRLSEQERWAGDKLVERETLQYRGEGRTLERSVTREAAAGRTVTRSYDDKGREESVLVEQSGKIVEELVHERDGEGRVVRTTKRAAEGLEQWSYAYGTDGELVREEFRRRGSLERVTLFESEGRRIEELFRRGELFLRVTYQDGEKVREEFFLEGRLMRTRDYP
jgi:hypothetical protein